MAAVKGISKLSGQAKSNTYPQPEGVLGDCMLLYGKKLGEDTVFCKFISININVVRVLFEDGEPNFVIQMDTVWREGALWREPGVRVTRTRRSVNAAWTRDVACTSRGGLTLPRHRTDARFICFFFRFVLSFRSHATCTQRGRCGCCALSRDSRVPGQYTPV